MSHEIGLPAGVLTCGFGELNPLSLSFSPYFVVISCSLKSKFQQQLLNRFKDNAGDTIIFCYHVRQIHYAWNSQPGTFVSYGSN
ncbi:hypothetical protein BvCmsSIP038_04859 [Escherichia coli]|nr:hypothetical protein BvCmsSIP038_04859 [Escherichia coli]